MSSDRRSEERLGGVTERRGDPNDIRQLVCEGPCNPSISDYDQIRERYLDGTAGKKEMQSLGRTLAHTPHVRIRNEFWDPNRGWMKTYKCGVCGHCRRF